MASRPVRVANCSGYKNDPYWQMLRQATLGDDDFITGDYLAEMNLAEDAEAYRAGKHDGWEDTAWEGIKESIDVIANKKIKVVLNGGCLNPAGLAKKVANLVSYIIYACCAQFKELLDGDWDDEYWLERVEFLGIYVVHFVIYGILGRGVSGSTRLDSLGKEFADYFRDKIVEVPVALLGAI